jgi:RHS repeat-associated protein
MSIELEVCARHVGHVIAGVGHFASRPQKLTDQSGNVAWDGVFDPFGNPASITSSLTMLLGFPGQYWDSETQLAQNWHRDYDPTIGRYIESDPIGLDGGDPNTYNYALGNAVLYVDRNGKEIACGSFYCGSRVPYPMGGPDQSPVPPPADCGFYNQACISHPNLYYCDVAPVVCNETPDSAWTRCVRACLQNDDKYCHDNGGTNPWGIGRIHVSCWTSCASH